MNDKPIKKLKAIPSIFVVCAVLLLGINGCEPQKENITNGNSASSNLKIISLVPNVTEILFELGFGGNIIGFSKHCNYPIKPPKDKVMGDYFSFDVEKIIISNPDVIFYRKSAGDMLGTRIREVKGNSIKIIAVPTAQTLKETYSEIMMIARQLNCVKKAEKLVRKMKRQISKMKPFEKGYEPKIYIEVDTRFAAGENSFLGDIALMAGAKTNIIGKLAGRNGYQAVSEISKLPTVILKLHPGKLGFEQNFSSGIKDASITV
ncbi:MAG TPA: ABC transporter substrate-binding protein, partial [Elusimicrobiales bacterium]|nr:ABC transporter substrate-binding protein [Elusimicrobiales bacterium]